MQFSVSALQALNATSYSNFDTAKMKDVFVQMNNTALARTLQLRTLVTTTEHKDREFMANTSSKEEFKAGATLQYTPERQSLYNFLGRWTANLE